MAHLQNHFITFAIQIFFHFMNYSGTPSLAPYHQLRKEIDTLCESLEKMHHQHLNCRKGCDLCCMAISVFPVEFFAIRAEMAQNPISGLPVPDNMEDCRFLVDHSCSIYPSRPVICRTHGLPLLYMSLESDEYELSLCELNFTAYDLEEFDEENTYPMDRINSKLYQINKNFIAGFEGGKYTEQDRIPLADLISLVKDDL